MRLDIGGIAADQARLQRGLDQLRIGLRRKARQRLADAGDAGIGPHLDRARSRPRNTLPTRSRSAAADFWVSGWAITSVMRISALFVSVGTHPPSIASATNRNAQRNCLAAKKPELLQMLIDRCVTDMENRESAMSPGIGRKHCSSPPSRLRRPGSPIQCRMRSRRPIRRPHRARESLCPPKARSPASSASPSPSPARRCAS